MAISLSDIKTSISGPPRILLYGVPGIGKTTLAAFAPSPIFIPVERGLGKLRVPAMPTPKTYEEVCEEVRALIDEPHDYGTLVIDGLDVFEALLWGHVCKTVKTDKGATVTNIHAYGYNKGFDHARDVWIRFCGLLDELRDHRGMAVIQVAHSSVTHFDSPVSDAYDKYAPGIQVKSEPVLRGWADAVLFLNYEVSVVDVDGRRDERRRAVGSGKRILYTQERPAWYAKNRYGLPPEIPVPEGDPQAVWDVMLPAMQDSEPAAVAGTNVSNVPTDQPQPQPTK